VGSRQIISRVCVTFVGLVGLFGAACTEPVEEEEQGSTDSEMKCSSDLATKLAQAAKAVDGKKSGGYCYRGVKNAMRAAGISTSPLDAGYGVSAYKFAEFARANPAALSKMGLKEAKIGVDEVPRGAIIVWGPGVCGYHKVHGHIEIAIDDNASRACSDFCGRIKRGCGTPSIFVPKGCGSGAKPDEGDAPDQSIKAPAESSGDATADSAPSDDSSDTATSNDETSGSCFSPSLGETVAPLTCVKSKSSGLWFQCKDGNWLRGAKSSQGPAGACRPR
jgi:hypothetical protein